MCGCLQSPFSAFQNIIQKFKLFSGLKFSFFFNSWVMEDLIPCKTYTHRNLSFFGLFLCVTKQFGTILLWGETEWGRMLVVWEPLELFPFWQWLVGFVLIGRVLPLFSCNYTVSDSRRGLLVPSNVKSGRRKLLHLGWNIPTQPSQQSCCAGNEESDSLLAPKKEVEQRVWWN